MTDLKLMSMNCRGLSGQQKRRDVINFLRNSEYDIIFLQDTHVTNETIATFDRLWPGTCYHSCGTHNSRGTAILLRRSLHHDVIAEDYEANGNYTMIVCKIFSSIYTLVNIYGPNADCPSFFNEINNKLQQLPPDNIVIAGDFNLVMNRVADSNYLHDNNIRAKQEFISLTETHSLIDIWRHMHPNQREFTWLKRNPLKHGRIDMIFISDHLTNYTNETKILSGYRTDHNCVTISVKISKEPRGPGLWKFNDSLLEEEKYTSLVKSVIVETIKQYATPVYDISFITNPLNFGEIQFNISIQLFYETLLMLIRGETVRYSKQKARKARETEQQTIIQINKIREDFALSGEERDADRLLLAQKQLENIRKPKIQGLIIRSRVRWYDEGEKCSKYFLSLEQTNAKRKSVHVIKANGSLITDKRNIISEFSKQLHDRYNKEHHPNTKDMSDFIKRNTKNMLKETQKEALEQPVSMSELTAALRSMKNGKSPGSNGFTVSFFKHFWDYIGIFLFRVLQQSVREGSLPMTHREAIVTLIPKTDKSPDSLKGWRPISLLNVDFKIFSSAITNRLKSVCNDIISPSQSAYIKGRSIAENTRLVYDVIHKTNEEKGD